MAASIIRIKRSSVSGKIPSANDVPLGELALNTYDGRLYASKNVGIGTTVFAVNPWTVGVGSDTYNTFFTAGSVGIGTTNATSTLQVQGDVLVSGVSTLGNTIVGGGTTQLVVNGDARITGILTVGTGSITLDGSTNTISGITTINTTSINGGPLAGFRNAIINGNFDHWQRGDKFTASEYGADRWFSTRTGCGHSITREPFTLGQTDVPGEPKYFLSTAVISVAGASNFAILRQYIEGVRSFAGQQITVSFWAKADAAKSIAIEFTQNFGTGGSASAEVTAIGSVKKTLTTSWQKITHTVTIPSISGKTLGSVDSNALRLFIWFDAGSSFNSRTDTLGQQSGTFDIAQVQIEAGPVATTFERRPIGTELALCQRYYCRIEGGIASRLGVGHNISTTVAVCTTQLPVPMRIAPIALEQSGTASHYDVNQGNTATVCSAVPTFSVANQYMATTFFTVASGLTVGQGSNCRLANASGYLAWSAEL